jgi:hypothetical protein
VNRSTVLVVLALLVVVLATLGFASIVALANEQRWE